MSRMTHRAPFDFFTRSAFGIEPGSRIGAKLEGLASRIDLPRGQTAPLDNTSDQIVFVASGATKLAAHTTQQRQQIVAFHFDGDIVSLSADGLFANSVTALRDSDLLAFPAREFFDLAVGEARIARSLLERLPTALQRCRDRAVALGQGSAIERLAGFLLGMSKRIGSVENDRCELDLPMSRKEIGESLGLTIETVSRQFGVLRELGLVETTGRSKVTILKLESLSGRAGHLRSTPKSSGDPANLISINVGFERSA